MNTPDLTDLYFQSYEPIFIFAYIACLMLVKSTLLDQPCYKHKYLEANKA